MGPGVSVFVCECVYVFVRVRVEGGCLCVYLDELVCSFANLWGFVCVFVCLCEGMCMC